MTAPFPVAASARRVDLDAQRQEHVAGIAHVFGRDVRVLHLDGAGYRALYDLDEQKASPDIRPLWAIVERVCPDLTVEEVWRLDAQQVGSILGLAQNTIRQVEAAHAPNAEGPVLTLAFGPASPSETPSATS